MQVDRCEVSKLVGNVFERTYGDEIEPELRARVIARLRSGANR
jgi:hypothetical protein